MQAGHPPARLSQSLSRGRTGVLALGTRALYIFSEMYGDDTETSRRITPQFVVNGELS